jgi:hypothetical protein
VRRVVRHVIPPAPHHQERLRDHVVGMVGTDDSRRPRMHTRRERPKQRPELSLDGTSPHITGRPHTLPSRRRATDHTRAANRRPSRGGRHEDGRGAPGAARESAPAGRRCTTR